jgi:hypothetical protein
MKRAIILLFVILGLACCVRSAQGAIITIAIEGFVDYVEDPGGLLAGSIFVGDLITGTYTYDTSTPDTNPLVDYASYWQTGPPAGISLVVNALQFGSNPDSLNYRIGIADGYESSDIYSVRSNNNLAVSDHLSPTDIYWKLEDITGTALSGTELPWTPPKLDDWGVNALTITADRRFSIKAHVTHVMGVPEPMTVIMLGLGAIGLTGRRRCADRR